DRDLVVEAIVEAAEPKLELLRTLDGIVQSTDAILASNTSSIPITKLATATDRPERVVGIHFFNPVPVLPLVELVPSLRTSEETAQRAQQHAEDALGKTVSRAQDRAGFIVNGLLVPCQLTAISIYEAGYATAADVAR